MRITHAGELLTDPGCSATAAARAVGYRDLRTFSRLVRRRLGCPVSALRQQQDSIAVHMAARVQ